MSLFSRILVVVDATQDQHPQLDRALRLAATDAAQLHLVDVVKDMQLTVRLLSRDYAHVHELLVKEKREQLERLVARCREAGCPAEGEVLEGVSSQLTRQAAERFKADLIVRPAKGTSSRQTGNLGTSSQKLLQQLPCAAWLAAPEHEPCARKIVAAVDATPGDTAHRQLNVRILETARQLAAGDSAELSICYVWSLYGSEILRHRLPPSEFDTLMQANRQQHQQSFDELLAECEQTDTNWQADMLEGEPSQALPEHCQCKSADLLVCGTVARHGLSGLLLGNTAERIVNRVGCSVLALMPGKV